MSKDVLFQQLDTRKVLTGTTIPFKLNNPNNIAITGTMLIRHMLLDGNSLVDLVAQPYCQRFKDVPHDTNANLNAFETKDFACMFTRPEKLPGFSNHGTCYVALVFQTATMQVVSPTLEIQLPPKKNKLPVAFAGGVTTQYDALAQEFVKNKEGLVKSFTEHVKTVQVFMEDVQKSLKEFQAKKQDAKLTIQQKQNLIQFQHVFNVMYVDCMQIYFFSMKKDVTIQDGEAYPGGTHLLKIWQVENTGPAKWPIGTRLQFVAAKSYLKKGCTELAKENSENCIFLRDNELLEPGKVGEVSVQLKVPTVKTNKKYQAFYRFIDSLGRQFGDMMYVMIEAVPEVKK